MENSGKPNSNLSSDGFKQDDGDRRDSSAYSVDVSGLGRTARSPQPPKVTYHAPLRLTPTSRPIAPAPLQTVTAIMPPTVTTAQNFIPKPVVRINTTELPLISGVPTSLTVCHPANPIPSMTVPVSSGTMASIIRTSHPMQQGPVNPMHIPHPTISASYSTHVPRGAAAVASITPPRAAVATPILRPPHSQTVSMPNSTVHPQIQPRNNIPSIRALNPPKVSSASTIITEAHRPHALTGALATIQVGTHLRTNEANVRPVLGSNTVSKPVHVSQPVVSTLQQLPDKGYYKPHLGASISVAASPVVVPVQQQQQQQAQQQPQQHSITPCIQSNAQANAIVTAQPAVHAVPGTIQVTSSPRLPTHLTVTQGPSQITQSIMSMPKIIHTVAAITPQPQQIVSVPSVTSKSNFGPPHTSTNLSASNSRLTSTTSIPVAKVHPQPLPISTRPNIEVSADGGSTLNLLLPSQQHTTTTNQQQTNPVGTANLVLMETPQERTGLTQAGPYTVSTYYYEPYQNTITVPPPYTSGATSTFSTLQPGSTIRLPSHSNQNLSAGVSSMSRSASLSPMMVTVEPGRPLTLHTNYSSGSEGIVTTSEPAVASTVPSSIYAVNSTYTGTQTLSCNATSSVSSSPRPSILRKRTSEGLSVVRKNLLQAMPSSEPVSPRPDSATTSPRPPSEPSRDNGFLSHHQDEKNNFVSNVVIKTEPVDSTESSTNSNSLSNGITEASPRKKPRKQQLCGNELVEAHSTDAEDEFEKDSKENVKQEMIQRDEDGVHWVSSRPRPNISLINSYRHSWKSRHNHFLHYSDVKPKEERRSNISDLANQKGMLQKLNGWKIYHLTAQLDEVVEQEDGVHVRLGEFLNRLNENCKFDEGREKNGVSELIKGNLQRCRIIRDQMKEARQQVLKVVDHKPHIIDILSKYISKDHRRRGIKT